MTLKYESAVFALGPCPQCGTHLAPTLLACPSCGRLVHGERLQVLAEAARAATDRGDLPATLTSWREALDLLPRESRQHEAIAAKITELGALGVVPASPSADGKSARSKVTGWAGAAGLLLWKLKALFLGLGKATTLLSMLASMWIYAMYWGWKFAVGIVLSIYIHEMGHMIALRQLGFKSSNPTFIPFIGALIRLKQKIVNPAEDAIIGLAGPIYGLGAASASFALWYVTKKPVFAGIAEFAAYMNLFNLLPVWTLDGGRGFHALSRVQKFIATAAVGGAFYFCQSDAQSGLLILLGIICLGRAFSDKSDPKGDWNAAAKYSGLVILLSLLAAICQDILLRAGIKGY